jgi:hypothetical protein
VSGERSDMKENVDIHLAAGKVYQSDPNFHAVCAMLGEVRRTMTPLSALNMDLLRADLAARARVDPSLLGRAKNDRRRPLRIHVVRRFPYELISSNGSINQINESMRVARDGRALAISCEFAAAKLFGLHIASSSNQQDFDAYGLTQVRGRGVLTTHAIRTLTTHGVKCVKSSKCGGGRKSTDEDVVQYAESVDSMIFIDVTSAHTFSIIDLPSSDFLALLKRSEKTELDPEFGELMKKMKYGAFWDALLKLFYLDFVEVDHTQLLFQDIAASVGSGTTSAKEVDYLFDQIKYELGHKLRIVAEVQAIMRNNPYFDGDVERMELSKRSLMLKQLVADRLGRGDQQKEKHAGRAGAPIVLPASAQKRRLAVGAVAPLGVAGSQAQRQAAI